MTTATYDTHPTLGTTRPRYKRKDSGARLALTFAFLPLHVVVSGWALQQIFNLLVAGHYPVADMTLVAAVGIGLFLRIILVVNRYESDEQRWYDAQISVGEDMKAKFGRLALMVVAVGLAWIIDYFA